MAKKRRVFEQGHARKWLVVVDESPEVENALYYAAGRAVHTGGTIVLLYVIEPDNQFWEAVRQAQLEEQTTKAKALFRLFRRKLNNEGFESAVTEEVIREGKIVEEILKQIDEDEDIAVLVLGASREATGPGPLVSSFAAGATAGKFPIPITIVPGELNFEDIKALA
ncbi:MAG TPA: universal stress protein [Hyphomicrobiaceae bacterium]|jgi:nucleotide-binding universal stress UspA family protein|nr:universal stress protein [Hyphomicrobiaceae bacterium]